MAQRSAPSRPASAATRARGRGGVQGRLGRGRGRSGDKPRFKPTQKSRAVVMLDDAPEIKPVGNVGEIKFWAPRHRPR